MSTTTLAARLDPAAVLRVWGPDAGAYLQGQFSNDVRPKAADSHAAVYGVWLSHKGRVLADSHVLRTGADEFLVVSAHGPAGVVRERIESNIIADEVEVADFSGAWAGIALAGSRASEILDAAGVAVVDAAHFAVRDGARAFRSRRGGRDSFEILTSREHADVWLQRVIEAGAPAPAAENAFDFRRVRDGVPAVPAELGPGDLPSEGGIEAEAVSLTKGCYLGQEVMARLHNLGQVRRRLHVVRWAAAPRELVFPVDLFVGERKVGELRSLVRGNGGGETPLGLAMLQLTAVSPGMSLAAGPNGSAEVVVERVAEGRAW